MGSYEQIATTTIAEKSRREPHGNVLHNYRFEIRILFPIDIRNLYAAL